MTRPMFTRRGILLACAACAMLAGCHSKPIPADPTVFGPTRELSRSVTMKEAWAFVLDLKGGETRSRRFEIVDGQHKGHERRLDVRSEGDVIVLESTLDGAEKPDSVERMRVTSEGTLVSESSLTRSKKVITEFVPDLLVFPVSLEPKTPVVTKNEFLVHPMSDPKKVKDRGKATQTSTLVGLEHVKLSEGTVDAAHVRTVLMIDFGVATVERTTDQWFAIDPKDGGASSLVAESYDEIIKVMGIQTERDTGTMRAIEHPKTAKK